MDVSIRHQLSEVRQLEEDASVDTESALSEAEEVNQLEDSASVDTESALSEDEEVRLLEDNESAYALTVTPPPSPPLPPLNPQAVKNIPSHERRVPYATALIWPNMEVLALVVFTPLLVGKAATALSLAHVSNCCSGWTCGLPWLVIVCTALFLIRTARLIYRFSSSGAAKRMFEPTAPPMTPTDTADPLFRLFNLFRSAAGWPLIQRSRGEYHIKPTITAEPDTSLRILRQPFGHFGYNYKDNPLAAARTLHFVWVSAAHGSRPWFVFNTLVINVVLCIFLGTTPLEVAYYSYWRFQRCAILVLLSCAVLWSRVCVPSADRLIGWVVTVLFVFHAVAAWFIVAGHDLESYDLDESLRVATTLRALSAWVPLSLMGYDIAFVPIYNLAQTHGCYPIIFTKATDRLILLVLQLLETLSGYRWAPIDKQYYDQKFADTGPDSREGKRASDMWDNSSSSSSSSGSWPPPWHEEPAFQPLISERTTGSIREMDAIRAILPALLGGPTRPAYGRKLSLQIGRTRVAIRRVSETDGGAADRL